MALFFGILAIVFAGLNIYAAFQGKRAEIFRFSSMALTAVTVGVFYNDAAGEVLAQDWSALEDVVPTVAPILLVCIAASIALNSISFFVKR